MTEKERLSELLEKAIRYADENYHGRPFDGKFCGLMADYLLANGVIAPPCKAGDDAYYLTTIDTETELGVAEIFDGKICSVTQEITNMWIFCRYNNGLTYHHTADEIGETVFLTRDEAEAALKERSANNG